MPRIAACHISPHFLSAPLTTQKCISHISTAASHSAQLIVFPETFIPAFPIWSALLAPTHNHAIFHALVASSIYSDGPEVIALCAAAARHRIYVSVGISEKVRWSSATLFNANLIIGPDGRILVHHRKLMPTFFEKLVWAQGDGKGLEVVEAEWGKFGMLICGENTNPLARYSLMAQGEQLHISTWPAVWPTRVPIGEGEGEVQGRAEGKGKNYDNVAANRTRAAAHCFEAKCFGVLCAGHLDEAAVDTLAEASADPEYIKRVVEKSPRGATMFLDPTGAPLMGFVFDKSGNGIEKEFLQDEAGILYAEVDLEDCVEGKQYHDLVGGYQRLDVFQVKINRQRREPATFVDSTHFEELGK
ncbi:carbon-nitrogen hydrolase [Saccharata proteae CBS 121410]|uniref:Carbon-nitrogen hydrolase n=1 Tax=Saccharata proteae CBS 121410 TaxID=1314787 RepID=A0A9P4HUU0_9PEZI|nr:carbon-nitrogen hydrolase [Saccharata proteae CBS 121410]